MKLNKKSNLKFHHIDCTLRDGGYYNNWYFSNKLVGEYINTMKKIGILNIEIGFWSPKKKLDYGLYGNIPNKLLKNKIFSKDLMYGLMINCSDIKEFQYKNLINQIKKIYNIKFIRIACHKNEISFAIGFANLLKKINIKPIINLMQISDYTTIELTKVTNILNSSKFEILYIADSFGSLNKISLKKIIKNINKFNGELGLHAHDNCGLALQNTIFGLKKGISWIDSTVLGMGRGAGNTKTEDIINLYNKKNNKFIQKLIANNFLDLKKKYNWGKNIYYKLAAKKSIHPTYVQTMLANKLFKKENISFILNEISKYNSKKFDPFNIIELNNFYTKKTTGQNLSHFIKSRDILICGTQKKVNLNKSKNKIINFIKNNKKKLIVLNLNNQNIIPKKLINFYVMSHPLKISISKNLKNKKIILPFSNLNQKIKKKFANSEIFDYGIKIKKDNFEAKSKYVISPNYLVISYALGICASVKVKKIYIYGLDGFDKKLIQFGETQKVLKFFKKKYNKIKIIFLNKTHYKF